MSLSVLCAAAMLQPAVRAEMPPDPPLLGMVAISAPNHRPISPLSWHRPVPPIQEIKKQMGESRFLFSLSEDGQVLIALDRRTHGPATASGMLEILAKASVQGGLLAPADIPPGLSPALAAAAMRATPESRFIVTAQQTIRLTGPGESLILRVADSKTWREMRSIRIAHPLPMQITFTPVGEKAPEPPPQPKIEGLDEFGLPGVLITTFRLGAVAASYEDEALETYHKHMAELRSRAASLVTGLAWTQTPFQGPPQGAVRDLPDDLLGRLRAAEDIDGVRPVPGLRDRFLAYRTSWSISVSFGDEKGMGTIELLKF